jgi:hypothetical protein
MPSGSTPDGVTVEDGGITIRGQFAETHLSREYLAAVTKIALDVAFDKAYAEVAYERGVQSLRQSLFGGREQVPVTVERDLDRAYLNRSLLPRTSVARLGARPAALVPPRRKVAPPLSPLATFYRLQQASGLR